MKKKTAIIIIIVCVLAVVAVVILGRQAHRKNQSITALQGVRIDALEILEAGNTAGPFVEDGSNEELGAVFTLRVRNNGEKTLQYALLHLVCAGKEYVFALSSLPVNEVVVVQEQAHQSCTADGDWQSFAEYLIWFEEEPSLCEDVFSLDTAANSISLQNISDTDVTGPISVYYKNWDGENLVGGITYRVTLHNGLPAGECDNSYASHYLPEGSRLMFIDYVP